MRSSFAVVARLGDRLRRQESLGYGGWRDAKALVMLVAERGDWNGAACMAEALGLSPDATEAIYREVYGDNPQTMTFTITTAGRAIPEPTRERQPA